MEITISIDEYQLSANDKDLIKSCLGIKDDTELEAALSKLCKASFMEYVKMFKEKGIPTRADEVAQERLFHLLLYYYQDHLPNENQISTIFQLTASQSRTLLRNTKSRYRTKISSYIKKSLAEIIGKATYNEKEKKYWFLCHSTVLIEELNLIIGQEGTEEKVIAKAKDAAIKYECSEDTFLLLERVLLNKKPKTK